MDEVEWEERVEWSEAMEYDGEECEKAGENGEMDDGAVTTCACDLAFIARQMSRSASFPIRSGAINEGKCSEPCSRGTAATTAVGQGGTAAIET